MNASNAMAEFQSDLSQAFPVLFEYMSRASFESVLQIYDEEGTIRIMIIF